ncbi:hypothetical protein DRN44_06180 [Thermococci archaeon]|nr:MAG: hypothetical protein DRN44_06180 [Thermococci archaeon]
MERKKFDSISELKEFIDSEGEESDILEYKDYKTNDDVKRHQDEIIDCIVALANKRGGYLIIGVDDDKNLVYANNIVFPLFKDQVEKWIDSFVDPRGLLDMQIKRVSDDKGQCIIIYVNSKPGVCFARRKEGREKGVTSYFFPYRIGGSTKKLNFEDFFKIYVQKFLESLAVSSELIKKEEEKMHPIRVRVISGKEKPFNSELVNNYINILRTLKLSTKNIDRLLQSIRNEVLKVYSRRKINEEDLPAIKNLVAFACEFIKNTDEGMTKKIFGILYLLTKVPETLHIVKETCYDYLKEIYEHGKRYDDLVKILDACGFFGDRIDGIMKAIESRDQKLLDILVSRLDFAAVKERKFELIKELVLKTNSLDQERDKEIINKVFNLITQLEEL